MLIDLLFIGGAEGVGAKFDSSVFSNKYNILLFKYGGNQSLFLFLLKYTEYIFLLSRCNTANKVYVLNLSFKNEIIELSSSIFFFIRIYFVFIYFVFIFFLLLCFNNLYILLLLLLVLLFFLLLFFLFSGIIFSTNSKNFIFLYNISFNCSQKNN